MTELDEPAVPFRLVAMFGGRSQFAEVTTSLAKREP
jgi:hypothetical protein